MTSAPPPGYGGPRPVPPRHGSSSTPPTPARRRGTSKLDEVAPAIVTSALAMCGISTFVLALRTSNSGIGFDGQDETIQVMTMVLLALGLLGAAAVGLHRRAITWPAFVMLPLLIAQSMYFLAYLSILDGADWFAAFCSGFGALIAIILVIRSAMVDGRATSGSTRALVVTGGIGALSGAYFFFADGWKVAFLGSDFSAYAVTMGSRWISGGSGIDWWVSISALLGAILIPFLAGWADDVEFGWSLAIGSLLQILITYALPCWYWISGDLTATPALIGFAFSFAAAVGLFVLRSIQLKDQGLDPIDILSGRP